ncbi:GntR family transcriptional regulator [Kineococcus sp. SYSU DK003]|uniref:GntR family transcriptional regulator n=1 Tax=Kineococcus sp. SYSU DK003 TaxID=3383124 RepID=UPI003D7D0DB9
MPTATLAPPVAHVTTDPRIVLVRDLVREDIRRGRFDSGAILPGEHELMLEYSTTRSVIRGALQMLRAEGLIDRRQGTGTYLVDRQAMHPLDHLSADIGAHYRRPRTVTGKLTVVDVMPAPAPIAAGLNITPSELVRHLDVEMYVDGVIYHIASSYIREEDAKGMQGTTFLGDYYNHMEASGVVLGEAEIAFEAVNADGPTATRLGLPVGRAVMLFRRITHDSTGRPVEIGFGRLRSDKLALVSRVPRRKETVA